MADIAVGPNELWWVQYKTKPKQRETFSLDDAKSKMRSDCVDGLGLYVDGWGAPWDCWFEGGYMVAQCPTAPKVIVKIVEQQRFVPGPNYQDTDSSCGD
jgi:hypothetical protein